jgi:hypothetical protein
MHIGRARTQEQAICTTLYFWENWPCILNWIGRNQKYTIFSNGWSSILTWGRC